AGKAIREPEFRHLPYHRRITHSRHRTAIGGHHRTPSWSISYSRGRPTTLRLQRDWAIPRLPLWPTSGSAIPTLVTQHGRPHRFRAGIDTAESRVPAPVTLTPKINSHTTKTNSPAPPTCPTSNT